MEKNFFDYFNKTIIENLKQNDETLEIKNLTGKTIIYIVDMINGFCKKGNMFSNSYQKIITPIKELIKKAQERKIEIIALNDAHSKNNPEFEVYPRHCLENSTESQLISELKFKEIKIINKNSTNGFLVINAKSALEYDNVIVVGCCTDICVYQFTQTYKTWCNQNNKKVNIIIAKSMTTTYDKEDHPEEIINQIFWHSMLQNGIKIVKTII